MKYTIINQEPAIIVALEGDLLGEAQGLALLSELEQKMETGNALFVINLEKLRYINSSGLNLLLKLFTQARKKGGEVILANLSEQLSKLLVITKLNAVFTVTENIDAAVAALQEESADTIDRQTN